MNGKLTFLRQPKLTRPGHFNSLFFHSQLEDISFLYRGLVKSHGGLRFDLWSQRRSWAQTLARTSLVYRYSGAKFWLKLTTKKTS